MKFLFSIMTLASIAGALMVLYAGAGSFLKLNSSSDEDKSYAAERAATVVTRIAQHNEALAKVQANGALSFRRLNLTSWSPQAAADEPVPNQPALATPWQTDANPIPRDEPKVHASVLPKLPTIQSFVQALAASQMFSMPAAAQAAPRFIIPRRTPTPAEEARAVYLKYATPQAPLR